METTEVAVQSEPTAESMQLTLPMKVLCVCFYSLLCIFSVYGNLLVILVIAYFRRLRTATNILILNLAVADLLIGVFCMPFSYWQVLILQDQRWIFGAGLCSLLSFLQGTAVFLGSWTLVVISFDRWMAIMFVLSPRMRLTRRKSMYLVLTTWVSSLTMALPLLAVTKLKTGVDGVDRCEEDWSAFDDAPGARRIYSYIVLALQYAVPQTVLIITYTFIGMRMWNSRVPGQNGSTKKAVNERHESVKKLIPMVVLVSALFAICWLPLLLLINVVIDVWPQVAEWPYILYVWWFCHGLAMLHSIVNPLVYYLRNARFREGFIYFSRFLPFVHFEEFQLLSDGTRRLRSDRFFSDGFSISTNARGSHCQHGSVYASQCKQEAMRGRIVNGQICEDCLHINNNNKPHNYNNNMSCKRAAARKMTVAATATRTKSLKEDRWRTKSDITVPTIPELPETVLLCPGNNGIHL